MTYEILYISPNYPDELTQHNRTLVGLVVDDKNKIVNQSFIKREALPDWFQMKRTVFSPLKHRFILAAISITGEVFDSHEIKGQPDNAKPLSH